ncbi:hypothetical protein P4530_19875 [Bacillus thuringiensis]|nr:hypothetical protein [Bacillus thuringiensis]
MNIRSGDTLMVESFSGLGRSTNCKNTKNISIHYFDDIKQVRGFVEGMEDEGWQRLVTIQVKISMVK